MNGHFFCRFQYFLPLKRLSFVKFIPHSAIDLALGNRRAIAGIGAAAGGNGGVC